MAKKEYSTGETFLFLWGMIFLFLVIFMGFDGVSSAILATISISFLFLLLFIEEIQAWRARKKRYVYRRREGIPTEVRQKVWHRDGGECQRCGSTEMIEYDHIIPVSKGGSNTENNIELLCKTCNRQKSARIE